MDSDPPVEAALSSETLLVNKEPTVPKKENLDLPALIPIAKINSGHNEEMLSLDKPQLPIEEPEVASNAEPVEICEEVVLELQESTTEVTESTTEAVESKTETAPSADEEVVPEKADNIVETITLEKLVEDATEDTETTNVEENVTEPESNSTGVLASSELVATKTENEENNVPKSDEPKLLDSNMIPDGHFEEVTELPEYAVEEVAVDQNTSGDTIEAENAVAQIMAPVEISIEAPIDEQPNAVVPEIEEVVIKNDINFPTEQLEEKQSAEVVYADEANISNEIDDMEYQVVLNDNQPEVVSLNGMPQLTKDDVGLYETEVAVKTDDEHSFDSQVISDVTISTSEVQNLETSEIISLASDNVTEVTFTDVQVLETHEGVVTISELNEQPQQEVVILQDENVLLMEAEEYDQAESIEVNIANSDASDFNEINEEQSEQDAGDPSKSVKIPCHVLGRNLENPLEDTVRNGRVLMKPRLGVKIPYRNLTSQIVSKQDIANEIMERSRLRQSSAEPPVGGDVFFAKKLTQRLAKKLTSPEKTTTKSTVKTSTSSPSASSSKKITSSSHRSVTSSKSPQVVSKQQTIVATSKVQVSPAVTPKSINSSNTPTILVSKSDKITDNSDLIALLEGDDDTDWTTLCPKKTDSNSNKTESQKKPDKSSSKKSPDWERETALKQLRELPYKLSRDHTKGSGSSKSNELLSVQSADKESKAEVAESVPPKDPLDPLDELKDDLNAEPRFSSSLVMKTYTRKRKPSEEILKPIVASSTIAQSPKKALVEQKSGSSQKQTSAIPQKQLTASSVQKHPSSTPQKTSLQKPSTTLNTPKSSATSLQKSVQKSSSSPSISKQSSNIPKVASIANIQKATSNPAQKIPSTPIQKTPASEKKQSNNAGEKKQPTSEKKQPSSANEKKQPTNASEKKESTSTSEKKQPATPVLAKPPVSTDSTESPMPKKALSPNTYISKSSRIVKRKKIWDPDEATPRFKVSATTKSPKPQDVPKTASPEKSVEKKAAKQVAVLKPNNEKALPKSAEKPESPVVKVEKKVGKPIAVLKPSNEKSPLKKVTVKKVIMKKKRPKRLTEVDRLLMDEGAVNLLYSVKNTEELQNLRKKKKKTIISIDRAQRELLNKTNEIKNDLQINSTKDSPISLRKKEGSTPKTSPAKDLAATILQRKKSKDSMTGSVHSPPASPGFAYSQHAEASRIIRRHSSSSFSSEDNDKDENEVGTERSTKHRTATAESPKKKLKVNHEKQSGGRNAPISVDKQLLNEEMSKNFNKPPPDDPRYSQFETFNVRKFDNLVQLIMAPTTSNGQTTLSIQVLTELTTVLDILQKDNTCRVVLLSSSGNSFCQGIDYKELVSEDQKECQSIAENVATSIREFLTSLTKFSKILVAGVHGNTVGVGVTMLPLFDMVLASDTATFSTPYARLGCAAEGGVLLTLPHVMHNALASELFFASRKLTAAEALRLGLVTRTLWPDKFQEELISALKIISGQSLQSMQAIKKQLRHHLLQNVENSLKSESATLVRHWMSNECQSNFSNYSLDSK